MDKSIPYNNLRITYKRATNLIFRKNRSQCCLNKRRRTSVLRACAGGAEGDFNKNQLDKLEFVHKQEPFANKNFKRIRGFIRERIYKKTVKSMKKRLKHYV